MDLVAFGSSIAILYAFLYKLNRGRPVLHLMYYKSPSRQIRMQKYQEILVTSRIKISLINIWSMVLIKFIAFIDGFCIIQIILFIDLLSEC